MEILLSHTTLKEVLDELLDPCAGLVFEPGPQLLESGVSKPIPADSGTSSD